MNQIWEFLIRYQYECLGILFAIQMIMILAAVIMIKKLNRHVNDIHNKVADYLEVILAEEDEKNEQPVAQHLVSEQERQMVNSIIAKKKQQEEAVFNAVLHEIFP